MKETPNWLTAKPWLKYTQSNNLSMIENAIYNEQPDERDLALMLSPYAQKFIEPMAQRAKSITLARHALCRSTCCKTAEDMCKHARI